MSLPGAHLAWEGGGEARFLTLSGEAVSLESTASSPPGSRPVGVLVEPPAAKVRVKVHGCKAMGDGLFRIEGRLIDATRELRGRVEGLVFARSTLRGNRTELGPVDWRRFEVDGETFFWTAYRSEQSVRHGPFEPMEYLTVSRAPNIRGVGMVLPVGTEVTEKHAVDLVRLFKADGRDIP